MLFIYRYLKGWFFLDLLSVLPFDTIGLVITKSAAGADAGGDAFDPSVLRIIRLVRFQRVLLLLYHGTGGSSFDCVGVDSFSFLVLLVLRITVVMCMCASVRFSLRMYVQASGA